MHFSEFRKILSTFTDTPGDIDLAKNRVLVQIRDDIIEASIRQREGDIIVSENGADSSSFQWLTRRIAKVEQLADRIRTLLPANDPFVIPDCTVLKQITGAPSEGEELRNNALVACKEMLDEGHAGFTNVVYLTSDAGEGKTTLIQELAVRQAEAFKAKQATWLLMPITLGGRSFLRFDDVIIGAIVERFRFPYIYYDSFIELVKLGVIVPAFDGFEEMFVESASGEAISAIGNLIRALDSSGSILISARRAFFEYMGFKAQARLFDSLNTYNVSFGRVALHRWNKEHFIEYARKCGYPDPAGVFQDVASVLGEGHPLLSRAVLVKNLLEVSKETSNRAALLAKLQGAPDDYFYSFVDTIIQREASEKWIDRSGQPFKQIIALTQHHLLMAELAHEMWVSSSDSIRVEVLDVLVEAFCDDQRLAPHVKRQVLERIKQYPLLTSSSGGRNTAFAFDHEEFKNFFLGEYVGRIVSQRDEVACRAVFQRGLLPSPSLQSAVALLRRNAVPVPEIMLFFHIFLKSESVISYAREAVGTMALSLLDGYSGERLVVDGVTVSTDALISTNLKGLEFVECYFQSQSLKNTHITDCEFKACRFERLTVFDDTKLVNVTFMDTPIDSLYIDGSDTGLFDPQQIEQRIKRLGAKISPERGEKAGQMTLLEPDEDLKLAQRVLRSFLRATFLPETVIRLKLGQRGAYFFDVVMPKLKKANVLVESTYSGAGNQRGYKLGTSMASVVDALSDSEGQLEAFLAHISKKAP